MDLRKEFEKETGNKPSYQPYMGRGGETFTSDYVKWLEQRLEAGQNDTIVMLQYDDAINIAKGCFDYSGGHRNKELETYHHGIQTVINALEGAKKSGLSDVQSKVLHRKGKAT